MNQPLDPEVAAVMGTTLVPAMDLHGVAAARALVVEPLTSDLVRRTDHLAPGDPAVPVRVHRPTSDDCRGPRPAVISMHGGGYLIGSHVADDVLFQDWCPRLGVVGIAVGYRHAPETPYPGALEDCYAALRWAFTNAADLGVDPARIGVWGRSSGGGLAAALALLARDRGEFPLAFQLLDCPMLDDRQITPSSRQAGLPRWPRESNAFGWRSYLGPLYGTADVPYTAAPARATDLSGLPPAFVAVGTVDGFRDEDIDYAVRLNQAGVPCELHVYPGAPHGFQSLPLSGVAQRAARDAAEWLARQLSGC